MHGIIDNSLELDDCRLCGEGRVEYRTSLAFETPVEQWHYAVSFLCAHIEAPAIIKIDTEITWGAAGFGLNDASFSRYVTEEVFLRPDAGRKTVSIYVAHPESEMHLIVRNVSDAGEATKGVIYSIQIIPNSTDTGSLPESKKLRRVSESQFVFAGHAFTRGEIAHKMFLGYSEQDAEILTRLIEPTAKGERGFTTDIYGIRTRIASLWPAMEVQDGSLWGVPIPGNWHWDTTEWIGLMRSVLEARDTYRIMELGAGWGPAAVGGGVLARLRGIEDIKLTAVEADPHHFKCLKQHLVDNHFSPNQYEIFEAAVGDRNGSAEWPDTPDTWAEYGNRPIEGRTFKRTHTVKVLSFRDLLLAQPQWDLVHVDIQGAEVEVCRSALDVLNKRVARVCIGTHSRKIEGDLIELFAENAWIMENEMPSRVVFSPKAKTLEAMNAVDGVQVWINPGSVRRFAQALLRHLRRSF